jgi:hypothetical protein
MLKSQLIDQPTPVAPKSRGSARPGGQLAGEIRRVPGLDSGEREQMFALLQRYFHGVTRPGFGRDLAEKEWAILLRDRQCGEIMGFSTLMSFESEGAGATVRVLFSGDTIIHPDYWGETVLPRLWAQLVFRLAAEIPGKKTYWFLICSGYKTYRFLPVYFRDFYPSCRHPTPLAVKGLLDVVAMQKFPDEYEPATGIVRLSASTPLKKGVAEVTPARHRDPHVAFFLGANPEYGTGDELACLTEISPDNLTRAGRRMLGLKEEPRR